MTISVRVWDRGLACPGTLARIESNTMTTKQARELAPGDVVTPRYDRAGAWCGGTVTHVYVGTTQVEITFDDQGGGVYRYGTFAPLSSVTVTHVNTIGGAL